MRGNSAAVGPLTTDVGARFAVAHATLGRLRLRLHPPHDPAELDAGRAALAGVAGVREVRANPSAWSLVVEYRAAECSVEQLLAAVLPAAARSQPTTPIFEDAVEVLTTITAPRAEVWRLLAHPEAASQYAPAGIALSGRPGDDQWKATVDIRGKQLVIDVRVTEYDPERRLVLDLSGALTGRMSVSLDGDGSQTSVRQRLEFVPPGTSIGKAVSRRALRPILRRELKAHVERVRTAAENGSHGSGLL